MFLPGDCPKMRVVGVFHVELVGFSSWEVFLANRLLETVQPLEVWGEGYCISVKLLNCSVRFAKAFAFYCGWQLKSKPGYIFLFRWILLNKSSVSTNLHCSFLTGASHVPCCCLQSFPIPHDSSCLAVVGFILEFTYER